MNEERHNLDDMIPLTPAVLHILLALAECERHGYGIMKQVETDTGGRVRMGPGTLYGAIKRMLGAGLVRESDERPDPELDDQRRRYYALTNMGRCVLDAELARLTDVVRMARDKGLLGRPGTAGVAGGA
jgi:DNA-binding PadR family transcriptional regulator